MDMWECFCGASSDAPSRSVQESCGMHVMLLQMYVMSVHV